MAALPGRALAQELIAQSREESRRTPMEGVIQAAKEGSLSDEQRFRLIGRLWGPRAHVLSRSQSMVPAGATHSHGWPVARAITSKSAS